MILGTNFECLDRIVMCSLIGNSIEFLWSEVYYDFESLKNIQPFDQPFEDQRTPLSELCQS